MKESLSVRFLYQTVPGRVILKLLVNPRVSRVAAALFSSGISAKIVPLFIMKNHIDKDRFVVPQGGYTSFNDFFTRKMKADCKKPAEAELICPCDGLLTVKKIHNNSIFKIKNSSYMLEELLKDRNIAAEFGGGTALIFRLTPAHYHRYDYCASGRILIRRKIPGVLHCVRPIALERDRVFVENSRDYTLINSELFGDIVQMEVGAMLVGRITNSQYDNPPHGVKVGTEKGYFEYGGSTIIVLLKKGVEINDAILSREKVDGEIPVEIGEALI